MKRRRLLATLGGVGAGVAGAVLVGDVPARVTGTKALSYAESFLYQASHVVGAYCSLVYGGKNGKGTVWQVQDFRREFSVQGKWHGLCVTQPGLRSLTFNLDAPRKQLPSLAKQLQGAVLANGEVAAAQIFGGRHFVVTVAVTSLQRDPRPLHRLIVAA